MKTKYPLHGITLERLLRELVEMHGWAELGRRINIRCFQYQPSITSSLRFLRRTPWARAKVEELYRQAMSRTPPPVIPTPGAGPLPGSETRLPGGGGSPDTLLA